MRECADRLSEIEVLLNPAFCAYLISKGLDSYTKKFNEGAPYVFPFVMLPLILHKSTRQSFPRNTRTTFLVWITNENTAKAKVGFAMRAKNMVPYVKNALIFGMQKNCICVTESGRLKTSNLISRRYSAATNEVRDCIKAAKMCGKWFSMVGDFNTVMTLLGIRP